MIHFSGELFHWRNAAVCKTPIAGFAKGAKVEQVPYTACDGPEIVMERAKSRLNETAYNILANNCEHFARWCKTGKHESVQVRDVLRNAGLITVGVGAFLVGTVVFRFARGARV